MSKISIKGILVGSIVDVVSSGIAGIPLVYYVLTHMGITTAQPGRAQQSVSAAVMSLVHADPLLRSIQLGLGLSCSVLGGYVAGRIAKHDTVLNGASSSFLCILIGLYSAAAGKALESSAGHVLLFGSSIAAAAFGGYLARNRGAVGAA